MYADEVSRAIHKTLISHKKTLALAESCTGGAMASRLVAIPGASAYFLGSIVAYSNDWKEVFLDVDPKTLEKEGAVSAPVARQMLEGLFANTSADFALSISGLLGPKEGLSSFFIAVGEREGEVDVEFFTAPQPRAEAIECAVETALSLLWSHIGGRFGV